MAYDGLDSLGDLDGIRKRPGMYVGSTNADDGQNPEGLIQILLEILSNSVDEAISGYGDKISLTIGEDNSITVQDFGRGIPRSKSKKKDDFDDVIRGFTVTHTSGKFNSDNYAAAGGLHGVGAKAANALSRWFNVSVNRENESYYINFEQDKVISKGVTKPKSDKTGTTIHFLPDDSVFSTINWDSHEVSQKIDMLAYLNPSVIFEIEDKRPDEEGNVPEKKIFHHENGLQDLVEDRAKSSEIISDKKPISIKGEFIYEGGKYVGNAADMKPKAGQNIVTVDISLAWTDSYDEVKMSFANSIPTVGGGDHLTYALNSVYSCINTFATQKKLLKSKEKLDASDTRDGIIIAVSVGVPENMLQFKGQTKDKLDSPGIRNTVADAVNDGLNKWLYSNEPKAKKLVNKFLSAKKAREAADKARKVSRLAKKTTNSSKDKFVNDEKLTAAKRIDPKLKELFIVEGDSAGGSAVNGRSMIEVKGRKVHNQGILRLRGKPINVIGAKDEEKVMKNNEFQSLMLALETGIHKEFDISKLSYDKIIILSDADDDGYHIRTLALAMLWKYAKEVVTEGHVYIAQPPLYKLTRYIGSKKEVKYALDKNEISKMDTKGWTIGRLKGLGEMNADELGYTTMNPASRHLKKVLVKEPDVAAARFKLFLAGNESSSSDKATQARKDWVNDNVSFLDLGEEEKIEKEDNILVDNNDMEGDV